MCQYRNCKVEVKGKRKGTKFCNTSCRKMEQTYQRRDLIKLTKQKEIIRNILNQIESNNDQTILELFNKIYNK